MRILVVVTAAVALTVALSPQQAWAPVPPRNCGMMDVGSRTYNVKADQLRCRRARRYAKRYLTSHDSPRGYSCRDYGRDTRIEFRCSKGSKVIFAIRR